MEERWKDPYAEGYDAAALGLGLSANPYQHGSQDYIAWCRGWNDHDEELGYVDLDEPAPDLTAEFRIR